MAKTETKASEQDIQERSALFDLFDSIYSNSKIDRALLFQNLGLFQRNSALAKILFINELYAMIHQQPGSIVELGCHLGQNLVLFENLRAIYEPFNTTRRIIGFDTFTRSGYASLTPEVDGAAEELTGTGYRLPDDYPMTLRKLLAYHEHNSVRPNHPRCEIIEGDIVETFPKFLADNPGEVIALAYFDLATYKATKIGLHAVRERLVPGSILLMDEFNFREYPGASAAFIEFASETKLHYDVMTSFFMRDRSIVRVR
jgi:hypothetical protein